MTTTHKIFVSSLAAVALLLQGAASAFAAATVSSNLTSNISADSANGSNAALPALVINEGSAADITATTLTWALPSGFIFDTSSPASVVYGGNGLGGSTVASFPDASHFSINIGSTSTASSTLSIGSVTPLKVRAVNGTPLAVAGKITMSGGTINGLNATTSFGTLTEVPGSPNKLMFTTQPPAAISTSSNFSAIVSVEDQFGNVVSSDNGRTIALSALPVSPTTTTGTLSGNLSLNDSFGTANFTALSFNTAGTIALRASSTPLLGATSTPIVVSTATSTPTPPPTPTSCGLANGSLVKAQGSATVYMVVNCVLRPFTTPAIFHARGKKFQNISIISNDLFGRVAIGRNIGEGSDDDSTIISQPTVSSTIPLPTTLPQGAIVKLPNSPTIYQVNDGELQPFTSSDSFKANGKKFQDVTVISNQEFSNFMIGEPVPQQKGGKKNK